MDNVAEAKDESGDGMEGKSRDSSTVESECFIDAGGLNTLLLELLVDPVSKD